MFDIQNASFSKRFGAGMFDLIIVVILATGFLLLCNTLFGYDTMYRQYEQDIERIEQTYNVSFDISSDAYAGLTDQQAQRYEEAYNALVADTAITGNYATLIKTIVLSVTVSVLSAFTVTDVVLPIFFKEGRTLGKKLFGICLISSNLVKVSNVQLVTRALLGKFAVETMVVLYFAVQLFFNSFGIVQLALIAILLIIQFCLYFVKGKKILLHDLLAQTVVVDYATQKIYENYESLIEAKKEQANEDCFKEPY